MKKKIISVLAVASVVASMAFTVNAQTTPKIIVDESELTFVDQIPIIEESTGRTLIPLRFVLESAGANVEWNAEKQTVTVNSGDNRNRVVLTIGKDDMQMYYYPSVRDVVSDTKKLDQVPVIMNDRTMIPVRAVLEAIGATVEWDETESVINVTSRAYARYLRDMGVAGYDVKYPLAVGEVEFDKPKPRESTEPYDAKKELPAISISSEKTKVAKNETFDIDVNLANVEKLGANALLTSMVLTLKYDDANISYESYTLIKDGKEYKTLLDAMNDNFLGDSLKIASITNLGVEESEPTKNGVIARITFKALSEEPTEISLSTRSNSDYGMDTYLSFKVDDKNSSYADATQIYVNTTPMVINAK